MRCRAMSEMGQTRASIAVPRTTAIGANATLQARATKVRKYTESGLFRLERWASKPANNDAD